MKSMFYEPALEILKEANGRQMSANEVRNLIKERYPELEWSGYQGPIRAMLIAAAQCDTPIRQVPDVMPPRFFYDNQLRDSGSVPTAGPEEMLAVAHEQCQKKLKDDLLVRLQKMDPARFEVLVNKLVEKMGFGRAVTTPKSRDGGIDGKVYADDLGLNVVCVQSKRYDGHSVQRQQIDAFIGALEGRNGIFVTTDDFSSGAIEKAKHPGCNSRLALVDGKQLVEFLVKHDIGVQTKTLYLIKEIDGEFFDEL